MTTSRAVDSVRKLANELAALNIGYPLDDNVVRPPVEHNLQLPLGLDELYRACDGMSLPDIRVGYFLDTVTQTATATARGEPSRIGSATGDAILVFGSDGGGGRFAIGLLTGAILYLASGGAVREGVYFEDGVARATQLSAGIPEFLETLHVDVAAFVGGNAQHVFIPDRCRNR